MPERQLLQILTKARCDKTLRIMCVRVGWAGRSRLTRKVS